MPRERVIGPPPEAGRHSLLCAAHDCPLLGSLSSSTTGSGSWLCAFHDASDADHWPETTGILRRLDKIVRLHEQMLNAIPGLPIPPATLQALCDRGFDEVAALADEKVKTCRQLGYAMRGWLKQQLPDRKPRESITEHMKAAGLRPFGEFT